MDAAEFNIRLQAMRNPRDQVVVKPTIALDGLRGRKRCTCGSRAGYAGPGSGPHWGVLRCVSCNRFLGWLSSRDAIDLGLMERAP